MSEAPLRHMQRPPSWPTCLRRRVPGARPATASIGGRSGTPRRAGGARPVTRRTICLAPDQVVTDHRRLPTIASLPVRVRLGVAENFTRWRCAAKSGCATRSCIEKFPIGMISAYRNVRSSVIVRPA